MSKNPFASQTFVKIWNKHFNGSLPVFTFRFINKICFVKHQFFPYYINVGRNLTNGITYELTDGDFDDFKGKTFLIRDLPTYHHIEKPKGTRLKLKKVFQYEGYTTNVEKYESLDDYLKTIYKSNSRSKFRRNINRLESCFQVDYKMYYGNILKTDFDNIFRVFYSLLEKRYNEKGEPCGELQPELWRYYCELAYNMINEKTASLFVIYCDEKPIGITFSYHFNKILIEALTVFDIDFYRFNIGHTAILKMLEWSFENKLQLFDYTQGDFDYKKRWSDSTYDTNFHILYDSKSIKSILTAKLMQHYFNLKRIFRERKFNEKYHYYKHKILPNYKSKSIEFKPFNVETENEVVPDFGKLELVNLQSDAMMSLRKALYDFLYMNPKKVSELQLFKCDETLYYVKGKDQILKIFIDE